jgi:hypothetical protein
VPDSDGTIKNTTIFVINTTISSDCTIAVIAVYTISRQYNYIYHHVDSKYVFLENSRYYSFIMLSHAFVLGKRLCYCQKAQAAQSAP